MKSKAKEIVKDCATGVGIGCAVIIPGLSAGTIAVITKTFNKIVNATEGLFSKSFFKNLLILLPFGIFGVLTVLLLIKPVNSALNYCLIGIISLFAGLIIGSIPGISKEGEININNASTFLLALLGFLISGCIGLCSFFFNLNDVISNLFFNNNWYLYLILFFVGIVGSTGLIVPGLSGSAILLILGFYSPILNIGENLIKFDNNFWKNFLLLFVFGIGVLVGFVLFSKLIKKSISNHKKSTYSVILGLLIGSIISIFVNSTTINYFLDGNFKTLDKILTPILLFVGIVGAYLLSKFSSKQNS